MKDKPKPCACNRGTQITAEDLFFNVNSRRQALKSAGEEMKKIQDVIGKYAIHNSNVSFTLKKQGETMLDLRTTGGCGPTSDSCPTRHAIGLVYGSPLARELLHFRCDDSLATLAFTAEGYLSSPSYSAKKYNFILFINNRLVECSALKRSLESVYANYGPAKSVAPFIYMKINIAPANIDVNVHPTKQLVKFLHETEIIEALEAAMKQTLDTCNVSKTFLVKNFPAADPIEATTSSQNEKSNGDDSRKRQAENKNGTQKKLEPHNMVRTDGSGRRLDEFFGSQQSPASQNIRVNFVDFTTEKRTENDGAGKTPRSTEIVVEEASTVSVAETSKPAPDTHITDEVVCCCFSLNYIQVREY